MSEETTFDRTGDTDRACELGILNVGEALRSATGVGARPGCCTKPALIASGAVRWRRGDPEACLVVVLRGGPLPVMGKGIPVMGRFCFIATGRRHAPALPGRFDNLETCLISLAGCATTLFCARW